MSMAEEIKFEKLLKINVKETLMKCENSKAYSKFKQSSYMKVSYFGMADGEHTIEKVLKMNLKVISIRKISTEI